MQEKINGKSGQNQINMQDSNRAEVLRFLALHPGCSRAELGEATGLTQASMTKIVRSLTKSGLIYETGFTAGKKGRRSVGLSLNYNRYKVLAIRLSAHWLEMQPHDFHGQPCGHLLSVPIEALSEANMPSIIERIADGVTTFLKDFPELTATAIAVPDPCRRADGSILIPSDTNTNTDTNTDTNTNTVADTATIKDTAKDTDKDATKNNSSAKLFPLCKKLEEQIDLPVFLIHDADAGAIACWHNLPGKNTGEVMLHIFADDSIEVGLTRGGLCLHDARMISMAGHLPIDPQGHVCPKCGRTGCLDSLASLSALESKANQELSAFPESLLNRVSAISARSVFESARQWDPLAMKLIRDCGHNLGLGIASLLSICTPDRIFISGGMTHGGMLLLEDAKKTATKHLASYQTLPPIELVSPDENRILTGTAYFAIQQLLNAPSRYLLPPDSEESKN